MEPFTTHTGIVAPLEALNVDTDQIIPKQFLKRIERTGYGRFLFYDWRYLDDAETPNPAFELNAARYQGATVLLSKENFGCGSSREHAPWALVDYGFRCILAPSFADIFYNNCFNNGLLPIRLDGDLVEGLFREVRASDGYTLTVDLPAQVVIAPDGRHIPFEISAFKKEMLVNGWDQVGLALRYEPDIAAYERGHGIG
ncbi:MAG TPA: 3-isopropylmalate dehydratase small subunit [Candidatus Hydrogenedentes bacterium]|nr:3-isopropylmalate dehydratase small subunit [Candidatus Hydrogenedentota bacterium]HPG67712.1 3-isopropylmalate dehydratase small subunit [Candidatus Hydrogenedentota bacterium]